MKPLLALLLLLSSASRAAEPWGGYQMLLWQDRTPAQLHGLAPLGFTGTKLGATGGRIDPAARELRQQSGLPYYLENLATDFYSPYHRYTAGKEVNWLLEADRARHRADPTDLTVFQRQPSLSDPAWISRIRTRLDQVVRTEAASHPLFYNLADESGIADLAASWDFDISPVALAEFRTWLHIQYPDLDALNREWATSYPAWDAIQPELTDAALRRTDANFAAWSDFKAWMDTAFARAVRAGTEAVHQADPAARAALEGGQIPGWGGYDYALLAPAVDVMEIYDNGEALDLATAFNPALIPLRTSFGTGMREAHATWRSLLHGGRGTVVWDERDEVVRLDGTPGPRGLEIAALTRALNPVAALLHDADPAPDPVAVLVNQSSFRVQWLQDRQAGDHDWPARTAEREYDDNAWRASRRVMLRRLAELGIQPRLVSTAMLEAGALRGSVRTLLLPHAIALSDQELAAIAAFRAAGGTVLADTEPGLFDGHGRRRAEPPLPDVPHPQAIRPDGDDPSPEGLTALAALLEAAGVAPRVQMSGPDGQKLTGVEARWFRGKQGTILALQTGRPWGAPTRIGLRFPSRMTITDCRAPGVPVLSDQIEVALDGVGPTILLLAVAP